MKWILTPEKYLSEEEAKRLKTVCSNAAALAEKRGHWLAIRDHMIISLTLATGLRAMEVSNLKTADLFLNSNESSLIVQKGKGGKRRVVRFGPRTKAGLIKYLQFRNTDSPYLFVSSKGENLSRSALQKIFKKWATRAGLPSHHSFHSMRHYLGCALYKKSNHNLRLVQQQLGHSSVSTTEIYADVMDEDAVEAISKFEEE